MANMNVVVLSGNLVRDPELRYTPSNTAVCDSAIAINEIRKNNQETTHFFDLVFWGRQAEIVNEYCRKGSNVNIQGQLRQDRWEDKDGNKRSKVFVNVEKLELGKKSSGSSKSNTKNAKDNTTNNSEYDSDIPF